MFRLLSVLIALAAVAYAAWVMQWAYLKEGAERVNRWTGARQRRICERLPPPAMTLEEKKRWLASIGIAVDPAATSLDPVHEALIRSRLIEVQIRMACRYE